VLAVAVLVIVAMLATFEMSAVEESHPTPYSRLFATDRV